MVIILWANVGCVMVIELGLLDPSNVIFYIGYLVEGFFIGALQIFIYELTAEISFPISPTVSIALLHLIAMPSILVITVFTNGVFKKEVSSTVINAVIQLAFAFIIGVIAFVLWQTEFRLKRIEFDKSR